MDKVDWISVIYLVESNAIELHKLPRRLPAIAAATGRLFQWSNPFRTLNYHGRRQPALLVIWTLLFIGYLPTGMHTGQVETSSWLERSGSSDPSSPSSSSSQSSGCAGCARERTLSALKEEEVRQWRIESTKRQILDRLEMDARPPRVKTKDAHHHQLPPEALLPVWQHKIEEYDQPARQIILFPAKIFRNRNVATHKNHQTNKGETLKFHITDEMIEAVLHSAILWTAQSIEENNNTASETSWDSSDVTEMVEQQIEQRHQQRHRYLSLPLPEKSTHRFAKRGSDDERHPEPYLIVQLDSSLRRSESGGGRSQRKKRNTTPMCSPGSTGCCRESLYISFKDVGWDDWILSPRGFHAFYCRGSCRTFTAVASSASSHASLLQKLISRDRVPDEARPHLAPCCAPTRLSPLTVFYSDESDVIKQRNLPNMIVESCGCTL